jgi:hypothetical protein
MSYIAGISADGLLSPLGTAAMPNLSLTQIYASNQSTGDHSLFTVPAGKKAVCIASVHNTSVGNIGCTPKMSFDGGVTYIQTNGATTPAANGTSNGITWEYVGAAGDVFGLTTATNNGANIFGIAYVFDASSVIKTVKLTSFTDGNNTLYTVPAGKKAFTPFGYGVLLTGSANASAMYAITTGATTVKFNIVQSGGSVGSTNQVSTASISSIGGPASFIAMNAGDFINVNTTAASTSLAWVTVVEYTP